MSYEVGGHPCPMKLAGIYGSYEVGGHPCPMKLAGIHVL